MRSVAPSVPGTCYKLLSPTHSPFFIYHREMFGLSASTSRGLLNTMTTSVGQGDENVEDTTAYNNRVYK